MNIVIYSKPDCMACKLTKRELDKMELIYTDIDITQDRAAEYDVKQMGFTSMPVVVVSNGKRTTRWFGFRPDKIKSLRETGDY